MTMLQMGQWNRLAVAKKVDFGLYLDAEPEPILLPTKYVPEGTNLGDRISVFVYTDSEDRPIATTLTPAAVVGQFACLTVKAVTGFGAFLDWGLEKDLLLPLGQQHDRVKVGQRCVVKVCLDADTGRAYATEKIVANCEKAPSDLDVGSKKDLLVYRISKIGVMVVVADRYAGMLFRNETFRPLAVGDRCEGYVKKVRTDGRLDMIMKAPGYGSVSASRAEVMAVLEKAGGFVPCHDKSAPEVISQHFAMSKKEFKRAVGGLYKSGAIEIRSDGIGLKKN